MREFFEVINDYPWTTFLLCWFVIIVLALIMQGFIKSKN